MMVPSPYHPGAAPPISRGFPAKHLASQAEGRGFDPRRPLTAPEGTGAHMPRKCQAFDAGAAESHYIGFVPNQPGAQTSWLLFGRIWGRQVRRTEVL